MNDIIISQSGATRKERLAAIQETLRAYQTRLLWVVDALIPADLALDMPSASQAHVIDAHLAQALLLRDDLQAPFLAVLERLPDAAPTSALQTLEALGATDFDLICKVVAGAFFLDEAVNTALGYTAQQAIREDPDYDYLMQAIEPVISRGEIYTRI